MGVLTPCLLTKKRWSHGNRRQGAALRKRLYGVRSYGATPKQTVTFYGDQCLDIGDYSRNIKMLINSDSIRATLTFYHDFQNQKSLYNLSIPQHRALASKITDEHRLVLEGLFKHSIQTQWSIGDIDLSS